MPGARSLGRALAAAYRSAGGPEQQVAVLRDTLAATSAAESAARAEGRDPDAARLAREVCQVRAWLLSAVGTGQGVETCGACKECGNNPA